MDRGLQFGDGVFETIRCEQFRLPWLELHLQRLQTGCERLGFAPPDAAQLRVELLAAAALTPRSLIKLIVTRGDAVARGYAPQGKERSRRVLYHYPQSDGPDAEEPHAGAPQTGGTSFRVGLSKVPLAENPRLAGIKHLNRLEQVLAQQEMRAAGWDEALMSTYAGQLISGTMSNLWLWLHGRLVTPALDSAGVAGVTRRVLLELAGRAGDGVMVRAVARSELEDVTSLYVSNVRLGLVRVSELEGRALDEQPVLEAMRSKVNAEFL